MSAPKKTLYLWDGFGDHNLSIWDQEEELVSYLEAIFLLITILSNGSSCDGSTLYLSWPGLWPLAHGAVVHLKWCACDGRITLNEIVTCDSQLWNHTEHSSYELKSFFFSC